MFDYPHSKTSRVGYGWPSFIGNRWCTGLKRQAISAVLSGNAYDKFTHKLYKLPKNITQYIGIAVDEYKRYNGKVFKNITHPLVEWNMTEKAALQAYYDRGFNFNGIYNFFDRVSCFCCPLKSMNELYKIYKYFPNLWAKIKCMDDKTQNFFRPNVSLSKLEKKFFEKNNLITFFNNY
jgi:hypothetical protein